jgi:hypothetical protein
MMLRLAELNAILPRVLLVSVGQLRGGVGREIVAVVRLFTVHRGAVAELRRPLEAFQRWEVAGKEPQLVLHDGTADSDTRVDTAAAVLAEGDVLGDVGVGRHQPERLALAAIHSVVVEVHVGIAVEVVAAGARNHVDYATGRAAELGGIARRLDLDFLYEVEGHPLALHARLGVGRLDAVDDEAVLAGGRSVDRNAVRLGLEVGAGRLGDDRAEVTPLRQLHELIGRDAVGALAALDVDERLLRRDLDRFREPGHAQCNIEHLGLAERELDAGERSRREARKLRGDLIGPGCERREPEEPARIADSAGHPSLGEVLGIDGDAGEDGPGVVLYGAFNRGPLFLGSSGSGHQPQAQQRRQSSHTHETSS